MSQPAGVGAKGWSCSPQQRGIWHSQLGEASYSWTPYFGLPARGSCVVTQGEVSEELHLSGLLQG